MTSIQRFLGHKKLSSTMIYARAHDQTVADDYFAAMQRVEERLEILPETKQETNDEVVKVQVAKLLTQLEARELCYEERLNITSKLHKMLVAGSKHTLPKIKIGR